MDQFDAAAVQLGQQPPEPLGGQARVDRRLPAHGPAVDSGERTTQDRADEAFHTDLIAHAHGDTLPGRAGQCFIRTE
ncbi:hypothetical protein [Couchioplanes azureus]|uniref:hypothetical protein n=1 Tax=Couchioplanes caeruleus TaxID=56438 RepID=UPI0016707F8B|nr:hypothetical protein [Couchioplanes caeruleus]